MGSHYSVFSKNGRWNILENKNKNSSKNASFLREPVHKRGTPVGLLQGPRVLLQGPRVVLEVWGLSYERGTPVRYAHSSECGITLGAMRDLTRE